MLDDAGIDYAPSIWSDRSWTPSGVRFLFRVRIPEVRRYAATSGYCLKPLRGDRATIPEGILRK
ncbi:hypothetical protein [Novipirellula galeiformis]|uniref:hypothetical protein n=1 Tax=Novipirellula galeiformis TaxID=2528004 RepID=UPI0011B37F53|nr:hypothetical protein [Novipirellula galeiformis]